MNHGTFLLVIHKEIKAMKKLRRKIYKTPKRILDYIKRDKETRSLVIGNPPFNDSK